MTIFRIGIAAALILSPVAAIAGASGFAIVNQSGAALSGLSVRRTGTSDWHPLGAGLSPGAMSKFSFTDPDCAFDIKATLAERDIRLRDIEKALHRIEGKLDK